MRPCGVLRPWHRYKRQRDTERLAGKSEEEMYADFVKRRPSHWRCPCAHEFNQQLRKLGWQLKQIPE